MVVEVDSGDGEVGAWGCWFFFEANDGALAVEFDDTVGAGIADFVGKEDSAIGIVAASEEAAEPSAVEDVIAEDESGRIALEEVLGEEEGVGDTEGFGLWKVFEMAAEGFAVAEELLEAGEIFRVGDDEDVADIGEHEDREGIVDHRFVVDGQKLFAHHAGEWIESRSCATRQEDPFQAGAPCTEFRKWDGEKVGRKPLRKQD